MASERDTVAATRRLKPRAVQAAASDASAGEGLVETLAFGDNPGGLRMFSYAPSALKPHAALVVVLHGCTQTADAHARNAGWMALAERCGFVVLAPEQRPANNLHRCFNWFKPDDAAREAASVVAMIAHAVRTQRLDASRVFVCGLSAGGAIASVLLATYPQVFAAGGIVAGMPFGVADSVHSAWGAMTGRRASAADLAQLVRLASPQVAEWPRVSIWHGDADTTVHAANAVDSIRQWVGAHDLAVESGEPETHGRCVKTVWRSPKSGQIVVELNLVQGLGHGVPLSTLSAEPIGTVGPFMLEAGVSAPYEMARFWGLLDKAKPKSPAAAVPMLEGRSRQDQRRGPQPRGLSALVNQVPAEVGAIIVKALKRARLTR
ncbi:MAG: alpha/beta hydrolase family esterase [Caulobacterales bacterium]|jgi:feruloyl esterase